MVLRKPHSFGARRSRHANVTIYKHQPRIPGPYGGLTAAGVWWWHAVRQDKNSRNRKAVTVTERLGRACANCHSGSHSTFSRTSRRGHLTARACSFSNFLVLLRVPSLAVALYIGQAQQMCSLTPTKTKQLMTRQQTQCTHLHRIKHNGVPRLSNW